MESIWIRTVFIIEPEASISYLDQSFFWYLWPMIAYSYSAEALLATLDNFDP